MTKLLLIHPEADAADRLSACWEAFADSISVIFAAGNRFSPGLKSRLIL